MIARYPQVQTFCLFIGPPRAGTSLVGALLDAHPDVVIGHETHALKLVARGMSRRRLFETLLTKSRDAAGKGRKEGGYAYTVEGQWQGRVRRLRVIGDKASGKTAVRLRRDFSELAGLERRVRIPVRLVHVTRNPYDTIARMSLIRKVDAPPRTLPEAIAAYAGLARATDDVIVRCANQVHTLRHESLIAAPRAELRRLCTFLGVEAEAPYLDACAGIVFPSPRRTRELVEWPEEDVHAVESVIARHAFLDGYSWSDGG